MNATPSIIRTKDRWRIGGTADVSVVLSRLASLESFRDSKIARSETMKTIVLSSMLSAVVGAFMAVSFWAHLYQPSAGLRASGPSDPGVSAGYSQAEPNEPQVNRFGPEIGSSIQNPQPNDLLPRGVTYTPEEEVNIRIYETSNRGVVNISTRGTRVENFFMMPVPSEGSGSGWVYDQSGHIVTNHHVVADSNFIEVTLYDGSSYPAEIVGEDPSSDVALLKIDAPREKLFPLTMGDSTILKVGQRVFAIGNPFGLERTMTVGIISSLNRTLPSKRTQRVISNVIQLDAALNQGNSGGPLIDSSGRVIGMNTAIASMTGENTGVGFAVPANTIGRILPELAKFGKVIRASIGIELFWQPQGDGLGIAKMTPGGAAELAGLQGWKREQSVERRGTIMIRREFINRDNADILLSINGEPITNVDHVQKIVDSKKPGEELMVTVLRGGRRMDVPVVLGNE